LSKPDSELDRYRALLRDADDEPKRLALIQLLIDEGAKDKFATKPTTVEPEPLPQPLPLIPLALTRPDVSSRDAASPNEVEVLGETSTSPAVDDVSMKIANLAARLKVHEPEPLPLPSKPPVPLSNHEPSRQPEPLNVAEDLDVGQTEQSLSPSSATSEPVFGGAVESTPSEPLPSDDLVSMIANLLSSPSTPSVTAPTGAKTATSSEPLPK
jgi:hypothetical protein